MLLRLASAVAAVLLVGAVPAYAQEPQGELWSGLNVGMTVEEVSAVLMAKPGVERTRLGRPDRDGVATLEVSKQRGALPVAEQRTLLRPNFVGGTLRTVEVRLLPSMFDRYCVPEASSLVSDVAQLLALKYSPVAGSTPQAFTNGTVRVTLSASTRPANNTFWDSKACLREHGDGTTVALVIKYEPEALAQARDNAQDQVDQDRLRQNLNGL